MSDEEKFEMLKANALTKYKAFLNEFYNIKFSDLHEIEKRTKILYSYNDAILSYNTYNEFINEKIKPRLL